jgi:hypothetical protein
MDIMHRMQVTLRIVRMDLTRVMDHIVRMGRIVRMVVIRVMGRIVRMVVIRVMQATIAVFSVVMPFNWNICDSKNVD